MEVLLIDDGSKDHSLNICREYEMLDARVKVFNKENSGVSDTRNFGIDHALGDYIIFVDADDYLISGALERIKLCLQTNGFPDMVIWGYTSNGSNQDNDHMMLSRHTHGFAPQELLYHIITIVPQERFRGFVWRCAFKKRILEENAIRFHRELKMAEDFKFILDVILASGRISVLQETLYFYRLNNLSVTSRYKENVHRDMLWVNQWMEKTICEKYPDLKRNMECCCAETYITAVQNLCNPGTEYGLGKRIFEAWSIKKKYQYGERIRTALSIWKYLTWKRRLVYLMLWLYMEPIYILLFSLKKGTLFSKQQ
jgi:glycosyltransferase involved in cell wall biosynthesis